MSIVIECPHCHKRYAGNEQVLRKNITCQSCQKPFIAKAVGNGAPPQPKSPQPPARTQPAAAKPPEAIECPQCHKRYAYNAALAGKQVPCAACGAQIPVPAAGAPPAARQPAAKPAAANKVSCPNCGQQYPRNPKMIGKSLTCMGCGSDFKVTAPGQPADEFGLAGAPAPGPLDDPLGDPPGAGDPLSDPLGDIPTSPAPAPRQQPAAAASPRKKEKKGKSRAGAAGDVSFYGNLLRIMTMVFAGGGVIVALCLGSRWLSDAGVLMPLFDELLELAEKLKTELPPEVMEGYAEGKSFSRGGWMLLFAAFLAGGGAGLAWFRMGHFGAGLFAAAMLLPMVFHLKTLLAGTIFLAAGGFALLSWVEISAGPTRDRRATWAGHPGIVFGGGGVCGLLLLLVLLGTLMAMLEESEAPAMAAQYEAELKQARQMVEMIDAAKQASTTPSTPPTPATVPTRTPPATPSTPAPPPTTPATLPTVAAGSIDLLKNVNTNRDKRAGPVRKLPNGSLMVPVWGPSYVTLDTQVPAEYELELQLERTRNVNALGIGLVNNGHKFLIEIDGKGGKLSGIQLIDGKWADTRQNPTGVHRQVLQNGSVYTIVCTVEKTGVRVTVNGEILINWQGEPSRLSVPGAWNKSSEIKPFLAAWDADYRVDKISLRPINGATMPQPGSSPPTVVNNPPRPESPKTLGMHKNADDLAFSRDNKRLISMSSATNTLWNVESGSQVTSIDASKSWFSWNGFHFLAKRNGTITTYRSEKGDALGAFNAISGRGGAVNWVEDIAYPNPDQLLLVSQTGISLVDSSSGTAIREFAKPDLADNDATWTVAVSPDQKLAVSGTARGKIRRWDFATGKPIGSWMKVSEKFVVDQVEFTADGKYFGASTLQGVHVFDAVRGSVLWKAQGPGIRSMCFSPDGKYVLIANKGDVELREASSGKTKWSANLDPLTVTAVAVSPDGKTLATTGNSGQVKLWKCAFAKRPEAPTQSAGPSPTPTPGFAATERITISASSSYIKLLAFSPDGSLLISVDEQNVSKAWSPQGRAQRTYNSSHFGSPDSLAFSPDGHRLALGGSSYGKLRIVDPKSGGPIKEIQTNPGRLVKLLADISPDGRSVLVMETDSTQNSANVARYDADSGKALKGPVKLVLPDGIVVNRVRLTPDGNQLAVANGAVILLVDAATLQVGATLRGHTGGVRDLAFNRAGTLMISGDSNGNVHVWEIASGARKHEITSPRKSNNIGGVAFSADSKFFVAGGGNYAGLKFFRVYDAANGNLLKELEHDSDVTAVAVSPDGKTVAVGTHRGKIRDFPGPTPTPPASNDPVAVATELTKAYEDDANAAKKKYGSFKRLTIQGVVKDLELDSEGDLTVTLAGHNDSADILCNTFKDAAATKAKLKPGQTIKVNGAWYGETAGLFLMGYSRLVEIVPDAQQ